MGRKISEDLFQLIRSLQRSEKRYFKIFSRRHIIGESNNYVRLFDAIDKQKTYDEAKLLKTLPFLSPRLFADQKNHLYWLILRSLVVYTPEKQSDAQLRFRLNCFDFLYAKELYPQCRKVILKTKETAVALEKHLFVAECLEREKKLELLFFHLKTSPGKIRGMNGQIAKAMEMYRLEQEYNSLSEEMYFILSEETFIRSARNKKRSRKIISDPLLKKRPAHIPSRALFNYHRTHSLYSYSHADFTGFHKHCAAIVHLIETQPLIHGENPKAYIVALQNLLIAQKNLERYDELFVTLRKLKGFGTESLATRAQIFAISHDIELTIYIDTGRFEKGILLARPIDEGLKKYHGFVSERYELLFCFNVAYNFFGCGNYRQALKWINRMINFPNAATAMPSLFQLAQLLSLIIHFELGNTDLVDYRIRSIVRTFEKKKALYKLESVILAFLSKAIITSSAQERQLLYQKLVHDLEKLHAHPGKRLAFSSFDFLSWAISKRTGQDMGEVVRKRGSR